MEQLTNQYLSIKSKKAGAELTSIVCNTTGKEYLWQADPQFWGRHSPILFPIVGSLWEGKYRHEGKEYAMSQHGFARDMDFEVMKKTETEVYYKLASSKATRSSYPFDFELIVSYTLDGNRLAVCWEVHNTGSEEMHFQIGAHPAFNYPNFDEKADLHGYFSFDCKDSFNYRLVGEKGCLATEPTYKQTLKDGLMALGADTFAKDALIVENSQVKEVTLLGADMKPQLTLAFDMPLIGLWSPPAKNAPFVCIEPWCGRCDREKYAGELKDRDWINHLGSNSIFKENYYLTING